MNKEVLARKLWILEVAEPIGLLIIQTYTAAFSYHTSNRP